jgi:mono/diheme cytochrome c family protein
MLKLPLVAALIAIAAGGTARADASKGAMLSAQLCAACHAAKPGEPSPKAAAPRFPSIAADPSITIFSLRAFLRTPHWTMPNMTLKPDDIDDIASYIVSLKAKP